MDEQLKQAFILYLQQKSGAQSQQELEAYIQQLGEEGLKQEYAQFMQLVQLQQQLQQVQAARFGAKLDYISTLRGNCPAGTEMRYFKQGGHICKKCMQKVEMKNGGKAQNAVDAFKCGRKMKKAEEGLKVKWQNTDNGLLYGKSPYLEVGDGYTSRLDYIRNPKSGFNIKRTVRYNDPFGEALPIDTTYVVRPSENGIPFTSIGFVDKKNNMDIDPSLNHRSRELFDDATDNIRSRSKRKK